MIKEDLVNCIVRYMDAVFVFDYLLQLPCTQILLFVEFDNQVNLVFIKHGLPSSGPLYGQQFVIL